MNLKYSQFNLLDEMSTDIYSIYNTKIGNHLILNFEKMPQAKIILEGNKSIHLLPKN